MRTRRVLLAALFLILGASCSEGFAQAQYKVLSSKEIFIYDLKDVDSVQVLDRVSGTLTKATSVTRVVPGATWWDVVFPSDVFVSADGTKTFDVLYNNAGGKAAPSLQVSLSPKLTIVLGGFGTIIREYSLTSNLVLMYGDRYVTQGIEERCDPPSKGDWIAVDLKEKSKAKTLHGRMQICTVNLDDARRNPEALSLVRIQLNSALVWRQDSFTVDPVSSNVLISRFSVDKSLSPVGAPSPILSFADGAAFSPPAAPATKDAAVLYANVQIAAGTGASGAWGLDGKVAYGVVPLFHGALTLLSATANTGNNTANIKGTTYTDTIDWMLPDGWAFSLWKKAPTTLTLIAGPKYETDYKFDKKNLLFSGDSIWSARKLFQPQNYRSKVVGGIMPKPGDDGYAKFGYELEFHAGIESGAALIDTSAQNTKKTQTITVPSYSIQRVVPQIHALYQQTVARAGLFSFDSLTTSRYLFTAENTAPQAPDGSLSLKQVSGWKAINTLTCSWNPPKRNNVGLTLTYKNGFDAPKFSRVNSILAGVLIEF